MATKVDKSTPCPDPSKGERCWVCGGSYLCLQSWRKKKASTNRARAPAPVLKQPKPKKPPELAPCHCGLMTGACDCKSRPRK